MKIQSSAMLLIAVLLFSCSGKEEPSGTALANPSTSSQIPPLQVTVLADLPDSLQPKVITLDQRPRPIRVAIPTQKGQTYENAFGEIIKMEPPLTKMLPSRKNAAGQPILDQAGKPLIPGDGGVSHFTNYTTEEGLLHDVVLFSYQDRAGFLWFGTGNGGVSRFDGTGFTTYTTAQGLGNNNVRSIIQDQAGHLWFGGFGGGASRFDGTGFTIYTIAQGLASNDVWCIAEDQAGHLWFGMSGAGVSRFDPEANNGQGSFTTFTTDQGLAGNTVSCITEDQRGRLWLGTEGGGVSRFDPEANNGQGSFTNFTTDQGLADNTVWCITEDQEGHLWIGTIGAGVSRFDPEANNGQGSFTTFTTDQGLADNTVWSITEDQDDQLWFGTDNGGVSCFDPEANNNQGSFTNYTLPGTFVRCIIEDQAGHLWFGTWGGGVSRLNRTGFTTYTTAQGLNSNFVQYLMADQADQLWFSNRRYGVSRFDRTSFTRYTTAQGLAGNNIRYIMEDQADRLWFSTWGRGVSRFDPEANNGQGSFTTYTTAQGLASNAVFCITEDQAGDIWFGTWGVGVSRFDDIGFTTYTPAQGLANKFVRRITEDQAGNLWFGTWGGGVSRFDGTSFTTYTTTQGLAGNFVGSITKDKTGNLWIGTDSGLSFLSKRQLEKPAVTPFQSFTTADGLADNIVTQVLQLPNGKIAVGSNQGITLFDPPQGATEDFTTLSGIEHYNTQSGYPVKNVVSAHLDRQGMMWIGTASDLTALVRFDYQAVRRNSTPPRLHVRQIRINQEAICWHDLQTPSNSKLLNPTIDGLQTPPHLTEEAVTLGKRLNYEERRNMQQKYAGVSFDSITPYYYIPQQLVLPYQSNSITFHYGTNELARPNLIEYQYQLEGYDDGWSPILKNTSATFGNMWEGNYTFKVKARYTGPSLEGADEWTEPLTYTFRVLPPWYRNWWVYGIYFLMAIASLWRFLQWRTTTLRKRQKILEQTVVARTAEVVAEQERSDELLLNILPAAVAQELKTTGKTQPVFFEEVSIMFADFKGFTNIVATIPGKKLISELDDIFQAYDDIMEEVGMEKIQTIGDAYLAAGGLPIPDPEHAEKCVHAAQRIIAYLEQRNQVEAIKWKVRIGIHSGSITAGVIGKKKFSYDLFGDTINVAARIESASEPGRINVSAFTYDLIKDHIPCTYRGKINAKGKGELDMYFVDGMEKSPPLRPLVG